MHIDTEEFRKRVQRDAEEILNKYVEKNVTYYTEKGKGRRIYFPARKWDVKEKLIPYAYVAAYIPYIGNFLVELNKKLRESDKRLRELKYSFERLKQTIENSFISDTCRTKDEAIRKNRQPIAQLFRKKRKSDESSPRRGG